MGWAVTHPQFYQSQQPRRAQQFAAQAFLRNPRTPAWTKSHPKTPRRASYSHTTAPRRAVAHPAIGYNW